VAFNRKRGEEQFTMRGGMLARRVIVGKLDANFVADALAPELPVEVIVRHAKLPSAQKKWPRRAAKVPEQWFNDPILLDHATLLRLRADEDTRVALREGCCTL
jgi:hypothetical protein